MAGEAVWHPAARRMTAFPFQSVGAVRTEAIIGPGLRLFQAYKLCAAAHMLAHSSTAGMRSVFGEGSGRPEHRRIIDEVKSFGDMTGHTCLAFLKERLAR